MLGCAWLVAERGLLIVGMSCEAVAPAPVLTSLACASVKEAMLKTARAAATNFHLEVLVDLSMAFSSLLCW